MKRSDLARSSITGVVALVGLVGLAWLWCTAAFILVGSTAGWISIAAFALMGVYLAAPLLDRSRAR